MNEISANHIERSRFLAICGIFMAVIALAMQADTRVDLPRPVGMLISIIFGAACTAFFVYGKKKVAGGFGLSDKRWILASRLWAAPAVLLIAASLLELVPRTFQAVESLEQVEGTISRVEYKNSMHRILVESDDIVRSEMRVSPALIPTGIELGVGQAIKASLDETSAVVQLIVDGKNAFTYAQYIRQQEATGRKLATGYLLIGAFLGSASLLSQTRAR